MVSLVVRINRSFILVFAFCLSLVLNIFFDEIIRYGDLQNLFFAVIFLFHNKRNDNVKNIVYTVLLLLPVYIFTYSSFLFFVSDLIKLFLIFSCVDAFVIFNLTPKHSRILAVALLLYSVAFIVCAFIPSFYSDDVGRYRGLFYGGNLSTSVLMFILAFLLEYYKISKYKAYVYLICFACFLVALFLCNTRSVLFVIPFLLWMYKENINFRKAWFLIVLLIVAGACYIAPNVNTILADLRLSTDESSYLTRVYLYEEEFNGIKNAHFIIPHGNGACITFIQKLTDNPNYSPHNDILSFWYDWGVVWLIVVFYLYYRIKRFVKSIGFGWGALLLFLFMMSCALHNILLYINIWLLVIFIMWRFRISYVSKNV